MSTRYILSLVMIGILCLSCNKDDVCSEGSGDIITKTMDIQSFTGIDLKISGDVVLTQGPIQNVSITGGENAINALKTNVENGVWRIKNKDACSNQDIHINITVPNIDKVYISGSGDIVVNNFNNQNDMTLKISGSGNMDLHAMTGCEHLVVKISGSGDVNLQDSFSPLELMTISMSGSGHFTGFNAPTKTCYISNSGSGSNKVSVINNLEVSISGSGNTYYKGNPNLDTSISGSGKVIDVN